MKATKNKRKFKPWALLRNFAAAGLGLYLLAALVIAPMANSSRLTCRGVRITVLDAQENGFVTSHEIARELGDFTSHAVGMKMADINTEKLLERLNNIDKIEEASIVKTTDGLVSVSVMPLTPVLRVFDDDESYYVNRAGKRIRASSHYHSDVPIISGHFPLRDTLFTPTHLLPLLDFIRADKTLRSLITMVKIDSPDDIILVPAIAGHLINFGQPTDFADKFSRIKRMYKEVLPVKGWDFYDTISVKWRGQIVATRRVKPQALTELAYGNEDDDADITTMLADEGVAPGRTRLGQKALSEKHIPGRNVAPDSSSTR